MRTVTLLFANPATCAREGDRMTSVATAALEQGAEGDEDRIPSEGVVVRVWTEGGVVMRVSAARGITTSDELYYHQDGGHLLLSDHFAFLLARLPVERREVPDSSLADHLLFRTTPGNATYVRGIGRLGHGERLEWTAGGAAPRRAGADRLTPLRTLRGQKAQLDAVEGALGEALSGTPVAEFDWANLLSGGIDSTLIHTYLGSVVPSTSVAIDSPEFGFEVEYALSASRLLGTRHELLRAEESRYAERLVESIETLGLPPQHLQTVLLDVAFGGEHGGYVTGQLADALFGLEGSLLGRRAWMLRHPLRSRRLRQTAGRVGALRRRVERWSAAERQVSLPAEHPDGYAMGYAVYSDLPMVRAVLGDRLVEERLAARLAYVRERVELPAVVGGLDSHLQLGHWIDFYCDDTVSLWRQLAHGRGKRLLAPFTHPTVARSALEVPPEVRYIRGGTAKHLLKSLLRRRLPAYPVDQPKGGSGLPFLRYSRPGGPIHALLESYPLPDFVDAELRRDLLEAPSWITWNVVTYAIWAERVLRNPHPTVPVEALRLAWGEAAGRAI